LETLTLHAGYGGCDVFGCAKYKKNPTKQRNTTISQNTTQQPRNSTQKRLPTRLQLTPDMAPTLRDVST
jgi:hypothetical protein